MDKSKMYRVYPTEPVSGYTHTYCMTENDAWEQLLEMEEQSGVEWAIQFPEWAKHKEGIMNVLSEVLEGMAQGEEADKLQHAIVMIDRYWNNE